MTNIVRVHGWEILKVRRARGITLRSGYYNYRVETKHINGHDDYYIIEAKDEMDAWQQMREWLDDAYKT
jgi:hypothetical protein